MTKKLLFLLIVLLRGACPHWLSQEAECRKDIELFDSFSVLCGHISFNKICCFINHNNYINCFESKSYVIRKSRITEDVKYSSLSQQFMQFLEFMKKIILIYFEIRYLCQLAVCCNIGSFLSVVSVMSQILSTQLYKFSESLTFPNPLRLSYIISYEYRALVRTTRYQTETTFKCFKTYDFVLN